MPRPVREVTGRLTGKFGFTSGRTKKHIHFELQLPGVPKVVTMISHGETEIRDDIFPLMAQQLKVNSARFRQMLDCAMGREAYETHLVEEARAAGKYRPPGR
jgi:hypothetical protein